jgi:hypothetical protein
MNMLISTNIVSIRPTERTEDVNKAEDKALVYIKKIVIRIYTVKNIYTKENIKKLKRLRIPTKKVLYL